MKCFPAPQLQVPQELDSQFFPWKLALMLIFSPQLHQDALSTFCHTHLSRLMGHPDLTTTACFHTRVAVATMSHHLCAIDFNNSQPSRNDLMPVKKITAFLLNTLLSQYTDAPNIYIYSSSFIFKKHFSQLPSCILAWSFSNRLSFDFKQRSKQNGIMGVMRSTQLVQWFLRPPWMK